ncbi:RNA ligase [Bacillus stercoris]|uniref:RNA ligase n=1 Tax=Bacillus stercoris TaxID=2054641 RepID=UPI003CE92A0E
MDNLKTILYSKLPTMTVEEYERYLEESRNGYININIHPEDGNIKILCYTPLTVFERRWNHETMTARGLIIDTSDINNGLIYILAKPFEKFFNYGENPEYEKDIDFTKIESVMEKMDGSLGISYFFDNEIRFATKGSFTSDQAIKATEMWKEKYSQNEDISLYCHAPVTYLVEIIYPENRVVVDYKDDECLVMLGTYYLFGYLPEHDADYEDVEWEAYRLDMPLAKQYKYTLEEMVQMKDKLSANEEGWVIRFANNKRLKIKGNEYLQVHRLMHGLSTKAKYKAWAENRIDEYIMALPEEFRPEIENFKNKIDRIYNVQSRLIKLTFNRIKKSMKTVNDKKEFALFVTKNIPSELQKYMFTIYDTGVFPEQMLKEEIYRNYGEYEEDLN